MLKLLLIGHDATRTGAPTSLLNLARWFHSVRGHDVRILLGSGGPMEEAYRQVAPVSRWNQPEPRPSLTGRLRRRLLGASGRARLSSSQQHILLDFATEGIDCILNNTSVNGEILRHLKRVVHVPVVSRVAELEAYLRKNNMNGSAQTVLDLSDRFIAVSQAVKNNLVQRYNIDPGRVDVVHGACNAGRIRRPAAGVREALGIPSDAFVVCGCGTMDWRKGIDLFIQVANAVLSRRAAGPSGIYFVWIGAPTSPQSAIEFTCEIESLGLHDRVFFLGEVEDANEWLCQCDLFILTSREDPFPLVMLEAARQALPIVCFEGSGGATEFVDASVGRHVPMLDIAGMAAAIVELRDVPKLRLELGEMAHQRSLRFNIKAMGMGIEAAIEKALAGPTDREPISRV